MSKKHTLEEFLEKAKIIHGNKYDYTKVVYNGVDYKIIIGCPEHGEFQQTAYSHLIGKGCNQCSIGINKVSTENFINKAREIHGDKYDYTKVIYVKSNEKVNIVCPEHGEFQQTPSGHLRNNGCLFCSGSKHNNETFIKKAREVHDDKYDYSKVEYVHASSKVIIGCSEHGEFEQIASVHMSGGGCPKCSGRAKLTTQDFIEKSKKVHDNKYDYSKAEYVNSNNNVIIICSKHGEFEQIASVHMGGGGCPKCNGKLMNTKYFIEESNIIHYDKYDYNKVEYLNGKTKVIIICPEHGEFKQIPKYHLKGSGCPKCVGRGYIYVNYEDVKNIIKLHGIKTREEYFKWWEDNVEYCRENGVPKYPDKYYRTHK